MKYFNLELSHDKTRKEIVFFSFFIQISFDKNLNCFMKKFQMLNIFNFFEKKFMEKQILFFVLSKDRRKDYKETFLL